MVINRRKQVALSSALAVILLASFVFAASRFYSSREVKAYTEVSQPTVILDAGATGWDIPNHAVNIKGELWGGGGGGGGCSLCGNYQSLGTTHDPRLAAQGGGGEGGGRSTFDWGQVAGRITVSVGSGGTGGVGNQSEGGFNPSDGSSSCSNGVSSVQSRSRAWRGCVQAGQGGDTTISHPSKTTVTALGGAGGYSAAADANGGRNYSGNAWVYGYGGGGRTGGGDGQSGYAYVNLVSSTDSGQPMRVAGETAWCNGAAAGQCGSGGVAESGGAGGQTDFILSTAGNQTGANITTTAPGNARSAPAIPGGGGSGAGGILMVRSVSCWSANGGGGAAGQIKIDYDIFTAQASISSLSPTTGFTSPASNTVNRTVTITGNFDDVDFNAFTVYFGSMAASIVSASTSQIVVTYPETTTIGTVAVKIAYTDNTYGFTDWETNALSFTYQDAYLIFSSATETLNITYAPSDVLPTDGVLATKTAIAISTNNPTGYTLSLAPQGGNTDLVCATNSGLKIPTIGSAGALSAGTYGYKVSSSNQNGVNSGWSPMLANQQIKSPSGPIDNDPINVWWGVRVTPSMAACTTYARTFMWTVVVNP